MNILILTSNTGGGHLKATEAIYEHIKLRNLDYNIKIFNTLDYINPYFNKLITSFYSECIKKYPDLFGKIYYYSEEEHIPVTIFSSILKSLSKKFLPTIEDFNPHIIISTHPFSTEMISYLKENGHIHNSKLINLLTDYAPHKFWIHDYVDAYITASEQMTKDMINRGVNKDIIYPIGIPVGTSFLVSYDKKKTLTSIGFSENRFTILLMSGSLGVDYVLKIFKMIIEIRRPIQIIIITGNNTLLYNKFKTIIKNSNNPFIKFHLLGFTKEVSKYMSISDVIITKPGGLTTTEAIFSNLPIIFFDAVPGQEEKNAEFILNNKMGMRISKSKESIDKFVKLIDDEYLLEEMRNNIISVRKDNFLDNLINIINSLLNKDDKN